MKKIKIPHTYALLFIIVILVTLLTYIIPAGTYERAVDEMTGKEFVVADSFQYIERSSVSIFDMFKAIPKGMEKASFIIFFVFIIGGAFGIVQGTGAINAGIGEVVKKTKGKEKLVIPVLMIIFSLAGAIIGAAEELLPFYPIVIALAIALGFDSITGTAMVLLGAGAGFAGAFLNPFTVGIAQSIAGLPMFSGIWFRLIVYIVLVLTTIIYVYKYANKIQKNPTLSPMYEKDKNHKDTFNLNEIETFNMKHKLVLLTLIIGLVFLAFGVINLGFYIHEISAIFLVTGIISGIVAKENINKMATDFVNGAKELVFGALVIGLATSITVIMQEGSIMDTIIYGLSSIVKGLPPTLSAVGMFIVQSFLNIIVPSGSGQAAVSMPIMAPMADVVGVTRQTSVLAFQLGDGFSNVISPTSGLFMAIIAIGGIEWEKWAKWMFPLFLIWSGIGASLVFISVLINYGPF